MWKCRVDLQNKYMEFGRKHLIIVFPSQLSHHKLISNDIKKIGKKTQNSKITNKKSRKNAEF